MSFFWQRWRKSPPPPRPTPECVAPWEQEIQAHIDANNWPSARSAIDAALTTHATHPGLLLQHARVLRIENQLDTALALCEELLSSSAEPAQVQWEISACQLALNDLPAAIDALQVAVTLDPQLGMAWLRLGELYTRLDEHVQAVDALEQAVAHTHTLQLQTRAWYALGQAHHGRQEVHKAVTCYEHCLALQADHIDAQQAMGHAKLWLEDESGALVHYEAALQLTAAPSQQLLSNLAIVRQHAGDLRGARELLERVISRQPGDYNTRWYLCQLDLLEGRWQAGWANYGARFGANASPYRPMPFQPWDGHARTDSTLLILADQGIGDEIMFASCFAEAIAANRTTLIECEPRLLQLFRRSFPQATFVATQRETTARWLEGLPTPQWQIASGDLPALFRPNDEAFPARSHYLQADPERVAYWRERLTQDLGPGLKIGVSWRGGTAKTRTKARSLSAEHWAPILSVPGVHFVNLQYGTYQTELAELNQRYGPRIHDYPEAIVDFEETAALVAALDLVVTVCTAIVHLSGALGSPVWILTPQVPGWRYTAHGQTLRWYPGSRIFRQSAHVGWATPCQELSDELLALTQTVGHPTGAT